MRAFASLFALLVACGSPEEAPSGPRDPFVAMQSDFDGFRGWTRYELPDIGLQHGHARGAPSHLYVNLAPEAVPPFAEPLPLGTVLLKTVERSEADGGWEIHAMVKRGGDFNARGAVGWEYLDLELTAGGAPAIVWRGEGSASNPGGYGRRLDGTPIACNDCHAMMRRSDHAFTRSMWSP